MNARTIITRCRCNDMWYDYVCDIIEQTYSLLNFTVAYIADYHVPSRFINFMKIGVMCNEIVCFD